MNSFSSNIAKGTEATLISKQKCFLDFYLSCDRSPVSRAVADEALSTKSFADAAVVFDEFFFEQINFGK